VTAPGVIKRSSGTPLIGLGLHIGLPAIIHDVLDPFERHVGSELKPLDHLFSREFGVPLPQFADANSIGCFVIETPPDPLVYRTSPRRIVMAFLQQCKCSADPKRVRRSHVGDQLLARETGVQYNVRTRERANSIGIRASGWSSPRRRAIL
jgi:hypothetical protein